MDDVIANGALLAVRELGVEGPLGGILVRDVSFELAVGQSLALVGPSGCGKSLTARALLGLLPAGFVQRGTVCWRGHELAADTWGAVRGSGLGLILQEPATGLNPVLSVGAQIAETWRTHRGGGHDEAWRAAVHLLDETRVPHPANAARQYAHELSGGMRQRALLAATLAGDPQLLIADEPTTALDVLVQREIVALIARIRRERNMALLFITHDLNLVPLVAERAAVMRAGQLDAIMSVADLDFPPPAPLADLTARAATPVLVAGEIRVWHRGRPRPAVDGVDLNLASGRAVGLLGESGCGKTTLGRALSLHLRPQEGTISLQGDDCLAASGAAGRALRRRVQMLFQDPGGSLDPRQRVAEALREAACQDGKSPAVLLAEVGLAQDIAARYPHELSGGQRQRVALARCLATAPTVLIADEPTSALDGCARDHVLSLLSRIQRQRGLAMLLISHDVEVLQGVCWEIHVMYAGMVVEILPGGRVSQSRHPYTVDLLEAVPRALRRHPESGLPQPIVPLASVPAEGAGCPYYGGCRIQKPTCGKELPPLEKIASRHYLRCWAAADCGPSQFIDTI